MTDETAEAHAPYAENRWSARLIRWLGILTLANILLDTVITTPIMILPQLLERFDTDQAALMNASAMLAGAMVIPLFGKCADIFGKRRMLVIALSAAGVGALVCVLAPNLGIFVVGRLLQGAAVATVFLTVALTREICAPRVAMAAVGIVTTGSAVAGIVEPFLFLSAIEQFGYQSVFVISAVTAVVSAICVRFLMPESPVRHRGRIDVLGAALLGGGLAGVLAYVIFGSEAGWLSGGMLVLLAVGIGALVGWVFVALRVREPIVDIRALTKPVVLTLLAVVLGAGAYVSMMQLKGLIAQVSPDLGLGYGLGGSEPAALLFAMPALGFMLGGMLSGWLAARVGPARTLFAGLALATIAAFGLLVGVSVFPVAVLCGTGLGIGMGSITASGFNLAAVVAPPERHGEVTGLIMVMIAVGSVVVNIATGEVLKGTATVVNGATVNTAAGVYAYIVLAGVLFFIAAVVAHVLARRQRGVPLTDAPPPVLV